MNDDDDRFIGSGENCLVPFTPEEKLEAQKRREQFDADVLKELNGNTNPTEEEEWEAVQKVLVRWYPERVARYKARLALEQQDGG